MSEPKRGYPCLKSGFWERGKVDVFTGIICAGINFVATWVYLVGRWHFFGIILGWMPALVAAAFGFFCRDVILELFN
jgi:hypothetical protein